MKNFIKKLLSDSNEISSKRFSLIVSLILLIVYFISIFFINLPEYVMWGLISIITSAAGLGTIEKFKNYGK